MKTHYVECICNSKEHNIRFIYDPEYKEYYIEFSLDKFPGIDYKIKSKSIFKWKLHLIKCYLINLWWSIKGRPLSFSADIIINNSEALKLVKFLNKTINKKN